MYFSSRSLLSLAAALVVSTSDAFVPVNTAASFGLKASGSSNALRMVADDAKVILVTGSSRGLGKSIATDLGKAGQKIVINYVSDGSKDAAEATVAEIKEAGGDAIAIQADSSDPDAIKELFAQSVEAFGTVDVLINNAGITRDGLVMRMKQDAWQAVIDTNLSGVFYCTQAFFKIAAKKRTGRIINISSVVGQFGNPGQANYAAAKGGVIALTMSNAKEFAARGIKVNCVCPGFIETDMVGELDEEYLAKVSEGIPLKRLGKPSEIAGMCKFLALDPSVEYITGHTFNVDGGMAIGC
ncbi:unnamed protein product [Pseudo-nitzschia multistriata]|uniref:3-oxoacyl-[acyl-carrier-protein] reductase n=1 Tax=Pseudo-nitzschia multistriata TaxID=183589 RepID=A0A448ZM31_9STRA|nr:unnamed protein product [Pseudo-nitzschia multistriata]